MEPKIIDKKIQNEIFNSWQLSVQINRKRNNRNYYNLSSDNYRIKEIIELFEMGEEEKYERKKYRHSKKALRQSLKNMKKRLSKSDYVFGKENIKGKELFENIDLDDTKSKKYSIFNIKQVSAFWEIYNSISSKGMAKELKLTVNQFNYYRKILRGTESKRDGKRIDDRIIDGNFYFKHKDIQWFKRALERYHKDKN